ncbi:MAG TPA: heavy metal translocating P-type ATPase, partial [Rhodospirillum rubrum]|nr:heavy metal translocating P-type ATPase [Rhodospirillum rubrum]
RCHGHDHGASPVGDVEGRRWWRSGRGMLTLGCGAALAVAYGLGLVFPPLADGLFIAAMLIGLLPIARRAFTSARYGSPFSIETLMTVAALGAVALGAVEEAAAVVFLFLVGEALEGLAAGRARAGIRALSALVPKTAQREGADGGVREVLADRLAIGDVIVVRPGDRVPADGLVLSGNGEVDEAPVTGESLPKAKAAGDGLFAGTINGIGLLRVRVTAAAADNTIARVVRLVEEATESKAPIARFIDRFARLYTPAVIAAALAVAVLPPMVLGGAWETWIYRALALLLIGCPCALVISTPAAIAAGLSAGARRGLLIKGGAVLEILGKVTTVAFDKTGTLTRGEPVVTDLQARALSAGEALALAAGLAEGSSHPVSRAILARARLDAILPRRIDDAGTRAGEGLDGTVDGEALFLGSPKAARRRMGGFEDDVDGAILALEQAGKTVSLLVLGEGATARVGAVFGLRDEPRPDAGEGVAALKAAGVEAMMLTGDTPHAARALGQGLDIAVHAGLMPEDKLRLVRERQNRGALVAVVGDGINDAPALAAADVGIAMGGGTDVALETADAAILRSRVGDVAAMIDLSKRTLAIIHQNVAIALGLKALFLVTTVAGLTGLWPAILADTGATVLVTANALRLLRRRR